QNVFPRPIEADEEFPFTETLAARSDGATALTWQHAQSGVVVRIWVRYLDAGPREIARKPGISGVFQCKIIRLHLLLKTLSHCKNSASGSRSAARKMTRWCAAKANTPTISICLARPMPGSCARPMPTGS